MRNHDYRQPLSVQIPQKLQNLRRADWVKHGSGFVQDKRLRLHGKSARDSQALLLPAGKRRRVNFLTPGKPHHFQGFGYAAAHFRPLHAQIFQTESDVILHAVADYLIVRILKDNAHQTAQILHVFIIPHFLAANQNPPGFRQQKSVQMPRQSAFAAAVRADDCPPFPLGNIERHTIQRPLAALIFIYQVFQLKHAFLPI